MQKLVTAILAALVLVMVASPTLASTYLANTQSMKFHLYNCPTIKHHDASHFVPYESRDACVADGYKPCKRCNP